MSKFFSPGTRGFYDRNIHGNKVPADAVEITDDDWRRLLSENSSGRDITVVDGNVVTVPHVEKEQVRFANARAARDAALESTDGLVARHRDEVELGGATTLTAEQYKELQGYRAALRMAPEQKGFPGCGLPPAPAFLASGN